MSSQDVIVGIGTLSFVGIIWTLFVLTRLSKKSRMLPHSQTIILIFFMLIFAIGGAIYYLFRLYQVPLTVARYPLYFIRSTGYYGTRINTTLVAVGILVTTRYKATINKSMKRLRITGIVLPILLSSLILAIKQNDIYDNYEALSPYLWFREEPIIAGVILSVCVISTTVSLILATRKEEQIKSEGNTESENLHIPNSIEEGDISKDTGVTTNKIIKDTKVPANENVENDRHHVQMLRHTSLLVYLIASMVIGKSSNIKNKNAYPVAVYISKIHIVLTILSRISMFTSFSNWLLYCHYHVSR